MIYVFYHNNCLDGQAAKFAAWLSLGDEGVTYVSVQYQQPLPDFDYTLADSVYILDFSYSREILLALKEKVGFLVVLDHHKTAAKELAGLEFAIFDMKESGCSLAWDYFHKPAPMPLLLQYVKDRDLWTWKLAQTKAVTKAIDANIDRDNPEWWSKAVHDLKTLERDGQVLVAQEDAVIASFLTRKKYVLKEYLGKRIAFFNTTSLISELGHAVNTTLVIDYSISFFMLPDGGVVFSFRAEAGGFDVTQVAEALGGGGHATASGASIPFPKSIEVLKSFYDLPTLME